MEVLFKYPEKEFSLSDLAKEAGVAKANIGSILNEFQAAGLINIEKLIYLEILSLTCLIKTS